MMRKREIIISEINSRIHKNNHNYRIDIPTSIKYGHRLDNENGNNFWRDANTTKMHNVRVEFEVLPEGYIPPVRYSNVTVHLIWYVKMDFN